MNRIYILGLAAILGLSACGESAQEKLARITLEKEKSARIIGDGIDKVRRCYFSAKTQTEQAQCKELSEKEDEISKIENEKIKKLMQE
jgi:hypothetical protein